MNDLRFTQIVDAYGSRPERWPVAERAAMQQYISTHAKAQQHINNQARLDAQLDADLITDLVAPILQHQIALEAASWRIYRPSCPFKLGKKKVWLIACLLGCCHHPTGRCFGDQR